MGKKLLGEICIIRAVTAELEWIWTTARVFKLPMRRKRPKW